MWLSYTISLLFTVASAQTVPLPLGDRSAGVTHAAGSAFFSSQFVGGGVFLVDVDTGFITTVVRPEPDRRAAGLAQRNGSLFVAGLGAFLEVLGAPEVPPRMFEYDVVTGETLRSCDAPVGALINDVVADDSFAYFTDSLLGNVYALPLDTEECLFETFELPRDAFPEGVGTISANGIALFSSGLIVTNFALGSLFFLDLETMNVRQLVPDGSIGFADGLEIVIDESDPTKASLFIAQNPLNIVSLWSVCEDEGGIELQLIRNISSPFFSFPVSPALGGGAFVVANAEVVEVSGPEEEMPDEEIFDLVVFRVGDSRAPYSPT